MKALMHRYATYGIAQNYRRQFLYSVLVGKMILAGRYYIVESI